MSDRADLPHFVREALDALAADGSAEAASAALPGASGAGQGSSTPIAADAELERGFAMLLEAAWPADGGGVGAAQAAPVGPSAALFERLEATVRELPYRYAPFFGRAAELFDLPEDAVVAALARLAEPKGWRFGGLPGIHVAPIEGGPKVASAETLFVRFAPGVRFPQHRHTGLERVFVLEGSYVDSTGVVHRAGELHECAEGTEHAFRVDVGQPCVAASVNFGRRFNAWPLRVLDALFNR